MYIIIVTLLEQQLQVSLCISSGVTVSKEIYETLQAPAFCNSKDD